MSAIASKEIEWLVNWFVRRVPGTSILSPEINYFEAGLIDSMGVMDLVLEVERHFGIRFSEKNFQDRRFATIRGLAEIILEISEKRR